jgi:hypothetical protein
MTEYVITCDLIIANRIRKFIHTFSAFDAGFARLSAIQFIYDRYGFDVYIIQSTIKVVTRKEYRA